MRDIILALIVAGAVPVSLIQPYIGVLVYSWISYMIPHRLTWGFMHDAPVAMLIGAATGVGWLMTRERKSVPMTGAMWLLVAFTLWCTFTTFFAILPSAATPKLVQFLKIMFMIFVTLSLIQSRKRLQLMVWVIVGSLGFYGMKSGLFTLASGGSSRVYGPGGMIEENNAFGVVMLMTIPLMRYLQITTPNKWVYLGLAGAMPLTLVAVLGTHSRGALVGLSILAAYFWWKSHKKVIFGIIGAAVLAGAITFMPDSWTNRMKTIETYEQDGSAQGRFDAWKFGYLIALAKPITGGGFNVFWDNDTFLAYVPEAPQGRAAHSIYFEVLGEHGFIGLAMFLGIGFLTLRNGRQVERMTRGRPELAQARALGAMVQVSVVGFAASGAFLTLAFLDLYWHLVAIAMINRTLTQQEVSQSAEQRADAAPAGARLGAPALAGAPAAAGQRVSFLRPRGERAPGARGST